MTQRSRYFVFVCGLACLFGLLSGCTVVYNEPTKPVTLDPVGKTDLAVELRLTDELQQAKWEEHVVSDHYIQPLGNALSINSEAMAKMLFREVKVTRGGSLSGPPSILGVDAVLIPEMASVTRDQPLTPFTDQTMAMQLKWTLNDQKGDPIWVTTIAGEGKGFPRSGWSKDTCKEQLDALLLDVFRKSAKEISGAELIRRYAGAAAKTGL